MEVPHPREALPIEGDLMAMDGTVDASVNIYESAIDSFALITFGTLRKCEASHTLKGFKRIVCNLLLGGRG